LPGDAFQVTHGLHPGVGNWPICKLAPGRFEVKESPSGMQGMVNAIIATTDLFLALVLSDWVLIGAALLAGVFFLAILVDHLRRRRRASRHGRH
jgi:hypothetical protein